MAPENYTTPFCASCESPEATAPSLDLELPEGAKFRSLPPRVSLAQMIQRSGQLRQWFPLGLPAAEERWQAKTTEEFHL
jgi:hypothetical protein